MPEISDLKYEYPMLRTPTTLMIDDWGIVFPCEDSSEYIKMEDFRRAYDFIKDMVSLGEKGVKGKITVLPYTVKQCNNVYKIIGRIDKGIKGIPKEKMFEILRFIKCQVTKYFDITPEMLTHSLTLDVDKECLLNEKEWEWSQNQDLKTLTKYITHALRILRNVGIIANGVTSPCNFGMEIEGIYARAVLEAEKRVNGITLTWYFLHVEPTRIGRQASLIKPRLMYLEEKKKEAVISIISGSRDYLGRQFKDEVNWDMAKLADKWITLDGDGGRLVELFKNRACIIFHTHWYNVYDEDKFGLRVLNEVISRLKRNFGKKIIWMKCSEIARYFATMKSSKIRMKVKNRKIELIFSSPFSCPFFTISFKTNEEPREVIVNGMKIKKVTNEVLLPNSWMIRNERVYLCFDLTNKTKVVLHF